LSSSEVIRRVDLGRHEACDLETEIEPAERKVLELLGQQLVIPGRDLGQPIIGDHEGAGLGRRQVIEAQSWDFSHAELTAGEQPAVPTDHVALAIDQHGNIKTEDPDAAGDLPDLPFGMDPWVAGIEF